MSAWQGWLFMAYLIIALIVATWTAIDNGSTYYTHSEPPPAFIVGVLWPLIAVLIAVAAVLDRLSRSKEPRP